MAATGDLNMKKYVVAIITLFSVVVSVNTASAQVPGAGSVTLSCGGAVNQDGDMLIGAGYELTCETIMSFPMEISSCSLYSYAVVPNPVKTPTALAIVSQSARQLLLQNKDLGIKGRLKRDENGVLLTAKFKLGQNLLLNCRSY